ncbi:hypothetical protein RBWH47_00299 [Rhodopirellula baltica WH47]|uniref:Uncharacterized protein n=1 Tax=Rhodopirellula baltica WH47 TaxID=991778 RepID=F2AUA7_RHOBT|nr:hypothetical protein RBWH47_00299 [Rhodopirellula baltica WH47]
MLQVDEHRLGRDCREDAVGALQSANCSMQIAKCINSAKPPASIDLQLPICNVHFAICNRPILHPDHDTSPRTGPAWGTFILSSSLTQTIGSELGCNEARRLNAARRNS